MAVRLRSEELSWQELDGEAVLLDLRRSTYLTINASGTTLLRLLSQDRTTEELEAALVAEYGIPRETAVADVAAFTAALAERDLLVN